MTERTAGDFPISPTTDWGRDLDILDPRYVADPFGVWRELRDGCPVAFSERRGRLGCRSTTTTSRRLLMTPITSRRGGSVSSICQRTNGRDGRC